MIIYYGSYSTTDGKEYRIGYEEGNSNTGDVIVEEMKNSEDEDDFLYKPKMLKKIKKGEKEIKEGKKVLWKYKNIIKDKLEKPINLKNLYYEQFNLIGGII